MVKAYSRYSETGSVGAIHSDAVGNTVAWSVDGKTIFTAVGTSVVQLNAKTGVKTGAISCSPIEKDEGLNASALSLKQPARTTTIALNNEYLGMGCTDGSVRIVRLPALSEDDQVAVFRGHRGPVNSLAFGEAGLVASGGRDTEIVIWDLVGESGVCRLTGHKGEITSLSFVPGTNDDFLVSGSKDGLIKVWSLKLQICVQTLTESKSEIWSICFIPTTRQLVAGSSDKVLYVYKLGTDLLIKNDGLKVFEFHGQLDRPESGGEGKICSLGVCQNVLVAQTDRRVVELWRIVTDESEKTKRMKRRAKRSDDDQIDTPIIRASDEFVIASSPESPSVPLRYIANGKLRAMSVSESGSIVLGLNDNQLEVFKLGCGDEDKIFVKESKMIKREGHRNGLVGVSVSSDNSRLVTVSSESIIVWNAVTLAFQKLIHSPSGEVLTACFVPHGPCDIIVLVTKDGHICGIDVNTGSMAGEPIALWNPTAQDEEDEVISTKKRKKNLDNEIKCVFVARNQIYMGTKSRQVFVVSLSIAADKSSIEFELQPNSFQIPDEPVCIAQSPKTGTYLAIGLMNSNVELIYSDTGKHYMSLYSHKLPVSAVAFTPDEQAIVSGSIDKNLKIWSMKFGNVLKSIRAHDAAISSLTFIPHSHMCWSTGRDGVVSLWDIDRFERVLSKVNHPSSEATCIAISRDAGMVFSGGLDRGVKRLTRSEDQMFIEEEMEKAMELEVEGEAQRDDMKVVDFTTPTKSSVESVRLVEKVIDMIEIDEEEIADAAIVLEKKKQLVKFVCVDIPPSELQQVVVSLPTGHARRLLAVIAEILELVRNPKTGSYPKGFPVEACVSAGLFLIQAQAKYLIGEPHSRQVLLKVKELFHEAISRQLSEVGMASASMRLLK